MTTEFFMPMHPPTVTHRSGQPDKKTDRSLVVFDLIRGVLLKPLPKLCDDCLDIFPTRSVSLGIPESAV